MLYYLNKKYIINIKIFKSLICEIFYCERAFRTYI